MGTGRRIANDAFPAFLYPFGGRYFAKGGTKPVLNSQEAVDALKFMKGLLPYSDPQTTTWVHQFTDSILRGEIAMGIVWNGNIKDVDNPEKSKVVGKIDVMPYPTQKINFGAVSGAWFYAVSKFSKNNRLADKFTDFATSFEAQKSATLNVGLPPTKLPVYLDPEVKKKDRLAEEYYNILSVAKTVRTNPKWMSMWTPVGTYLYMGVTGEISPEDAIKRAYEEMLKVE
ncbi:bacterial extracellular solute-binding protein [archaeon]|nr:bacterial extracellular solute-binding protein [archaeon]